jgi:tRNA (adenine57-N1/adenine58-N1)-methyltransferase
MKIFPNDPVFVQLYAKKPSKGWMCALRPTAELWTMGCSHRTEILYLSDISMIIANLGVKPGSLVIETGTGTGSLSTSFVTALQPSGRLYTFEYHDARAAGAAEDFDRNALAPWVTVTHRDTIANGFPSELDGKIDAVFLDLPAPWDVVASAKRALKHDAPFCSFSPCIEQIQSTAEKLTEHGFVNIETIECLQKAYDVRTLPIQKDFDEWDIESSDNPFPQINTKKRSRNDMETNLQTASSSSSLLLLSTETEPTHETESSILTPTLRPPSRARLGNDPNDSSMSKLASRPYPEMRGHTGYLIFARNYLLPPILSRPGSAAPVAKTSS